MDVVVLSGVSYRSSNLMSHQITSEQSVPSGVELHAESQQSCATSAICSPCLKESHRYLHESSKTTCFQLRLIRRRRLMCLGSASVSCKVAWKRSPFPLLGQSPSGFGRVQAGVFVMPCSGDCIDSDHAGREGLALHWHSSCCDCRLIE